jgi:hypothetical protein
MSLNPYWLKGCNVPVTLSPSYALTYPISGPYALQWRYNERFILLILEFQA